MTSTRSWHLGRLVIGFRPVGGVFGDRSGRGVPLGDRDAQ
ncbi:uncharacterized protein METZ01_LOCUS487152 [marine metagenome]|uniref:Uncharacterized protein n=1 Tax=marine metagenome TaxID=408172 RepID=A0A383CRR0_9ZZZZ